MLDGKRVKGLDQEARDPVLQRPFSGVAESPALSVPQSPLSMRGRSGGVFLILPSLDLRGEGGETP